MQFDSHSTFFSKSVFLFFCCRRPSLEVADFGCGDAKLSRSVPNKVHSFDLVAVNEHVTVCDMAKVSKCLLRKLQIIQHSFYHFSHLAAP